MSRVLIFVSGFLATLAAVPAIALVALLGLAGAGTPAAVSPGPSGTAMADIPPGMLALYRAAAPTCPGLSWTVLAAIGKIETDHNRATARSSAGAEGPMQFMPATWAAYGIDGNGDGVADIHDPADAVYSAAHYLCADGAGRPGGLAGAIYAYNHDDRYVQGVLTWAARYAAASATPSTLSQAAVLDDHRLRFTADARSDVASGAIDSRVLALLETLASRHHLGISVLRTGHDEYVAGTNRVSLHWLGRAADIATVDGLPVGPGSALARDLAVTIASLPPPLRPDELGQPWADLVAPGVFSDAAHQDHLHVGFR